MSLGHTSRYLAWIIRLCLIIAGLVLWLLSFVFKDQTFLNVPVSGFLSSVGSFLCILFVAQWTLDERLRRDLIDEVARQTIQNVRLAASGIKDFQSDTKKIDYEAVILNSATLTIASHYSIRVVTDNIELLERRCKDGKFTTILLADPKGTAIRVASGIAEESFETSAPLAKLKKIAEQLNSVGAGKISIRLHDVVLKYSFVATESEFWVKLYMNSHGRRAVPAIKVVAGSPLYQTYKNDLEKVSEGLKDEKIG